MKIVYELVIKCKGRTWEVVTQCFTLRDINKAIIRYKNSCEKWKVNMIIHPNTINKTIRTSY